MRLLGTRFNHSLVVSVIAGTLLLAAVPSAAYAREEPKVSMEDILKEISSMRRELRELKIQRDQDQRVIDDLRRIVENGVPALPGVVPEPATARSAEGRLPAKPANSASKPPGNMAPGGKHDALQSVIRSGQTSPSGPRDIR